MTSLLKQCGQPDNSVDGRSQGCQLSLFLAIKVHLFAIIVCLWSILMHKWHLPAGAVGGALADLLAQPLPGALESTYQGNQEEKDRQQHPSCVRTWTSLPQQARARFRETDVQVWPT